jgi:hypothetical protein
MEQEWDMSAFPHEEGDNPCTWLAGSESPIPNGFKLEVEFMGINLSCEGWLPSRGYGMTFTQDQFTERDCIRIRNDYYDWTVNYSTDHYKSLVAKHCNGDCEEIQADSTLKFLNYNTYQLFPDWCILSKICAIRDRMHKERLEDFVDNFMSDFDIMALQEVWSPGTQNRKAFFIDEAAKKGLNYHVVPDEWNEGY